MWQWRSDRVPLPGYSRDRRDLLPPGRRHRQPTLGSRLRPPVHRGGQRWVGGEREPGGIGPDGSGHGHRRHHVPGLQRRGWFSAAGDGPARHRTPLPQRDTHPGARVVGHPHRRRLRRTEGVGGCRGKWHRAAGAPRPGGLWPDVRRHWSTVPLVRRVLCGTEGRGHRWRDHLGRLPRRSRPRGVHDRKHPPPGRRGRGSPGNARGPPLLQRRRDSGRSLSGSRGGGAHPGSDELGLRPGESGRWRRANRPQHFRERSCLVRAGARHGQTDRSRPSLQCTHPAPFRSRTMAYREMR